MVFLVSVPLLQLGRVKGGGRRHWWKAALEAGEGTGKRQPLLHTSLAGADDP